MTTPAGRGRRRPPASASAGGRRGHMVAAAAGIGALALGGAWAGATSAAGRSAADAANGRAAADPHPQTFTPPPESAIPADAFGAVVKRGEAIFTDTGAQAGRYVGNALRCSNCHLDAGRLADAAPLAQAYVAYPAFRAKTGQVDTFAERLRDCFRYSMNGTLPPLGGDVLVALEAYAFFLAKGAPTGTTMAGRGYPVVAEPPLPRDYGRGEAVFAAKCATCHGGDGLGRKGGDGTASAPPLWGPESFNWGAGMTSIPVAAGFIKANMPRGQGWSLSDQDSWDVATFVDSHDRPQDPRFTGTVAATRAAFHDTPDSMYGRAVDGVVLGSRSPPAGPR